MKRPTTGSRSLAPLTPDSSKPVPAASDTRQPTTYAPQVAWLKQRLADERKLREKVEQVMTRLIESQEQQIADLRSGFIQQIATGLTEGGKR